MADLHLDPSSPPPDDALPHPDPQEFPPVPEHARARITAPLTDRDDQHYYDGPLGGTVRVDGTQFWFRVAGYLYPPSGDEDDNGPRTYVLITPAPDDEFDEVIRGQHDYRAVGWFPESALRKSPDG